MPGEVFKSLFSVFQNSEFFQNIRDYWFSGTMKSEESLEQVTDTPLMRRSADRNFYVVAIGSHGSGKNLFIKRECRFLDNEYEMDEVEDESYQISRFSKEYAINGKFLQVQYWTSPENPRCVQQFSRFFAGFPAYMLFFNVNNYESFVILVEWLENLRLHNDEKLALVGTGTDQAGRRQVSTEDARNFAEKFRMQYFEISEYDDDKTVAEIFERFIAEAGYTSIVDTGRLKDPTKEKNKYGIKGILKQYEQIPAIGLLYNMAIDTRTRTHYWYDLGQNKQLLSISTSNVDWLEN